jgi:capsular polysaccharide biosynthesis protein
MRRLNLGSSVARHPWIIVFCTVLFLVVGGVAGYERHPTYSSQASLIIGSSDPASPNFGGNVIAAGSLASAYSRAVSATGVIDKVSSRLGLSKAAVKGSLASAPVPDSPVFNVYATGTSADLAIKTVNTAANAIITYLVELNSANQAQTALLAQYEAASSKVIDDKSAVAAAFGPRGSSLALKKAEASRARDQLVLSSLGATYSGSLQANPPTAAVSSLTTADSAVSDHKSKTELFAFGGLLIGALIGVALAMFMSDRELRRVSAR